MQGPPSDRRSIRVALVAGLLTAGFSLGRLAPREAEPGPVDVARDLSAAIQSVSARLAPSVVQVRAYARSRNRLRARQDGSGVLVGEGGIVVTNHHVVADAVALRAVFSDGRTVDATVVGVDRETDLAVLRLEGDGPFEHTDLSERSDPRPGELVLAMGNPLGLGHTVTLGIVSGTGRTDLNIATYEDFIQTDAVINPGNSGGPLLDLDGKVLGINTAVGLESNGDEGIAFAIPSRMVAKVLADILSEGRVRRGWLGVETYPSWALRGGVAEGFEGISRVKVRGFAEDSPAESAGLRVDDVVLRIAERRVVTQKDLLNVIAETRPGTTVEVVVWRDGEERTLSVTLTERV